MTTTGQQSLDFDGAASAAAADAAIEQVEEAADEDWVETARSVVRTIAHRQQFFTTDDIWLWIDGVETHEPRAMGAILRWAQAEGLARNTHQVRKTERIVAHRRPLTIWESLVWQTSRGSD